MGRFNIIHFIEHIDDIDDKLTDTNIILLYDEDEGYFYYYGTRNTDYRDSKIFQNYINYEGKFHYTRLYALVDFISFLVDNFRNRITTEFHQINIHNKHYDTIDYSYLKSKLSTSSELVAYYTQIESYDNIYTYLETLIPHEI
jgi:hypothetical protein